MMDVRRWNHKLSRFEGTLFFAVLLIKFLDLFSAEGRAWHVCFRRHRVVDPTKPNNCDYYHGQREHRRAEIVLGIAWLRHLLEKVPEIGQETTGQRPRKQNTVSRTPAVIGGGACRVSSRGVNAWPYRALPTAVAVLRFSVSGVWMNGIQDHTRGWKQPTSIRGRVDTTARAHHKLSNPAR